ncbi:MAG: hypothetical protein JO036_00410 [Candidatus Eremiobacteraeota bacterium]|nr:hypothetical protein [Candidatus Eremiobacteraeota bacterium]
MEHTLSASIDPIEVAFVRKGFDTALDVAIVRAVESGALALEGRKLRIFDPAQAGPVSTDPITVALIGAAANSPTWSAARRSVRDHSQEVRRDLERRLVAAGLLRESSPFNWLTGRQTARGKAWMRSAQLAYPAAQIVALDPALALALHGPRALDGTRYHAATVAAATSAGSDGGGCGATLVEDGGGHGGHGGGGHGDGGGGHGGCSGGGGSCSGGGCGGGGCGG